MADESTAVKKPADDTYPVERLIAEADDRFDVAPNVAAGAFHGLRKKHLTVAEGKKAIDDFLQRPVEEDNPIGGVV